MRPHGIKLVEQLRVETHAATWVNVEFGHPATNAIGIELLVPATVKGIGQVNATSVPADLHHLWSAIQRHIGAVRVWLTPYNATQLHRACLHGLKWVGNVILQEFTRAPAGNV